jgi:hypothetical protein
MRREFVTQTWSASAHRASCFPRKTRRSVRRREYGAGRIGDLHQADKASPHGEGQLARTNVVQKQPQTRIRRPTPKNVAPENSELPGLVQRSRSPGAALISVPFSRTSPRPPVHRMVHRSELAAVHRPSATVAQRDCGHDTAQGENLASIRSGMECGQSTGTPGRRCVPGDDGGFDAIPGAGSPGVFRARGFPSPGFWVPGLWSLGL